MAGEVGVGAIGTGDFLRLGPLGDMLDGRRLVLLCFFLVCYTFSHRAAFNKCACSGDALREHGYKQVMLIPADKQPHIKLFHAEVDVILFATKRVDMKDVTGH